jgi:hypothetical protein
VFGAGGVAAAVGLAAFEEPFDQRGMKEWGRGFERVQELGFALAQGQRGSVAEGEYLAHIYP